MKKFLGILSAGVTSIMMFVCLSIPCLRYEIGGSELSSFNGWGILSGKTTIAGREVSAVFANLDNYSFMKTVMIIMLVLGCLLALLTIVMILQQTGVIKSKSDFNVFNLLLLVAFVVCAVLLLIAVAKFNSEISATENMFYTSGVGLILNTVISALMMLVGVCAVIPAKRAKRKRK